jgi:hypothetical protein
VAYRGLPARDAGRFPAVPGGSIASRPVTTPQPAWPANSAHPGAARASQRTGPAPAADRNREAATSTKAGAAQVSLTPASGRFRSRPDASRPPGEPDWSGMSRPAGHGPAPWPGPHRDLAGQPGGPPASGAHAGSPAWRYGSASCPHQPPSPPPANGQSRPSSGTVPRRPRRRSEHLAGRGTRPAHPRDRGLWMIAELLSHPLGAPPAAVGAYGRGDSRADLTRAGVIGALQRRHEQGVGPGRAGAGMVSR